MHLQLSNNPTQLLFNLNLNASLLSQDRALLHSSNLLPLVDLFLDKLSVIQALLRPV